MTLKQLSLGLVICLSSCAIDNEIESLDSVNSEAAVTPKTSKTIREYQINNCADGEVYNAYHFSEVGVLNRIDLIYFEEQILIAYDASDNISNLTKVDASGTVLISKDLSYDSDGHLLSLGDRTFEYVEDQKLYLEDVILGYDSDTWDDIVYVENRYEQYLVTPDNPTPQFCEYFEQVYTNTTTGEVTITGDCSAFSCSMAFTNSNLIRTGCGSSANYQFDITPNPLWNNQTNVIYILGFLSQDPDFRPSIFYPVVSKNNMTWNFYEPEDPESSLREYRTNADGLPESTRLQWYYVGNYEGSCEWAKYIYYD